MATSSEARAPGRALAIPVRAVVVGYAGATAGALALQGLAPPLVGTIACAVLVPWLLVHHAMAADSRMDALLALALLPLAAILAVAMPIEEVSPWLWPALAGAPVLLGVALTARRLGIGRPGLGLIRGAVSTQARIGAAGVPLGLLAYLVVRPDRIEAGLGPAAVVGAAVVVGVFAGAGEELLLRGLLQPLLVRLTGRSGIAWTAALSAALYAGTRSVAAVVLVGALSVLAGGLVQRTGAIAGVGVAHGVIVATALVVWPAVLGAPAPAPLMRPIERPAPVRVEAAAGVSPEVVRLRHHPGPSVPSGVSPEALRSRLFVPARPHVVHHVHRVPRVHRVHHTHRVRRRAVRRPVAVVPHRSFAPRPAPRRSFVPRPAPRPAPPVVQRPAPPPVSRPAPRPPVSRPAPRPVRRPAPRPAPKSAPSQTFDDSG